MTRTSTTTRAALTAALLLGRLSQADPPSDVVAVQGALVRIDVRKSYTTDGTQKPPGFGTGIIISADCNTVFILTAAHLLKPEYGEADFDPAVFVSPFVDRASSRAANVRRDFSNETPPRDLLVLETAAVGLRADIPRVTLRAPQTTLADGDRLFALAQFRNDDAPIVSTTVSMKPGASATLISYKAATIEEGFSGGPVVDARGQLVGVHLAKIEGNTLGSAMPASVVVDLLERAGIRTSNIITDLVSTPSRRYEVLDPKSLGGGFELADMLEFSAARQTYGPLPVPRGADVSIDWNGVRADQRVYADLAVAVEPGGALGRASIQNVGRNLVVQSTPVVSGMRDTTMPKQFRIEIPPDCGSQTYRIVAERMRNPSAGSGAIYGDVWAAGSMGVAELVQSLGGDSQTLVPFVRPDAWLPIPGSQDATVDWAAAQSTGIIAVVRVVLHAFSKSGDAAISVRLRELTTDRVVDQRDGMTNHTDGDRTVEFKLRGPRDTGTKRYRLEAALTTSDERASVSGYLVTLRQ